MKKTLTLIAAAITFGIAAPAVSQAWDRCNHGFQPRVVSYRPCGRPVLAIYQIYSYDRCGNPLGRWVTQREACGCSVCSPRSYCPPPSHGHHSHHHSSSQHRGLSWSFSFSR